MRRYSVFDSDTNYFDSYRNGELCRQVAHRCYLPANRMMLDLVQRHAGRFRLSYSISGSVTPGRNFMQAGGVWGWKNTAALRRFSSSNTGAKAGSPGQRSM